MPFPENAPRVDDLASMPPQDIAALPVELLAILQREIDETTKRVKAAKTRLDGALTIRYATRADEIRQAGGKDTGTVRFDDGDFTVVADLPKRIAWDQAQLARMVERIRAGGDDPTEIIDISYKVAERKFAAWPTSMQEAFRDARTVHPGKLKITLLDEGVSQ